MGNDPAQLAFESAVGGMNASDPPNKIQLNQLARMVNCVVVDGYPTTRPGVRDLPFSGSPAEVVREINCQGVKFYNPGRGQGGIRLAADASLIAYAAGGRKFIVKMMGSRSEAVAEFQEITGGLFTDPKLHLVWWGVWEDMLVANDGRANAFTWSHRDGAEFSPGYNTTEKEKSRIPNGGTVLGYAHARGVVVVNSRQILVGDSLHRIDLSSSSNLKEFKEQTYWATGQYFLPPSQLGEITAAEVLPSIDSVHGHDDFYVHCIDGVFPITLNIFPRSQWSERQMTRHAKLSAGAVGPYALSIYNRDQIFRTTNGIESLRSAAANAATEGSPYLDLGSAVSTWLKGDHKPWLRFCSACSWYDNKRWLVTTDPIVHGRYRWHRGVIVRSFDPIATQNTDSPMWEGLWTLPPQMNGIVQLVSGRFDRIERMFAVTLGTDGRTGISEFVPALHSDVLPDGTRQPIRCQCITREVDLGRFWEKREYEEVTLYLRQITGTVRFGVWFRTPESPTWKSVKSGTVTNPDSDELDSVIPRSLPIPLGRLQDKCDAVSGGKSNESRGVQFLVRWEGFCQFEGVRVEHGSKDLTNGTADCKNTFTFVPAVEGGYDDYEYSSSNSNPWFTT